MQLELRAGPLHLRELPLDEENGMRRLCRLQHWC